jgi:ABC-type sugar transport system ATPase subunit
MANVLLERISKHFGTVGVIENLDLHVEDREFLVLVGPSGCGNSTALRLISTNRSLS